MSRYTKDQTIMTAADPSAITEKTRELCQTIVDHPEFQRIRASIDAFVADDQTRAQYQAVVETGDRLQQKQRGGLPLSPEEIAEFESARDALLSNPVARAYLDAQQQMRDVQSSVTQYVTRTFELGRVPTEEDFAFCGLACVPGKPYCQYHVAVAFLGERMHDFHLIGIALIFGGIFLATRQ